MPDAAPPPSLSPTDRPQVAAPPRFCWPMRIFLGFLVFDMVFHSFAALTPADDWCKELGLRRFPDGLPSAEERRKLAEKSSTQDAHARLGANLQSPDPILIK